MAGVEHLSDDELMKLADQLQSRLAAKKRQQAVLQAQQPPAGGWSSLPTSPGEVKIDPNSLGWEAVGGMTHAAAQSLRQLGAGVIQSVTPTEWELNRSAKAIRDDAKKQIDDTKRAFATVGPSEPAVNPGTLGDMGAGAMAVSRIPSAAGKALPFVRQASPLLGKAASVVLSTAENALYAGADVQARTGDPEQAKTAMQWAGGLTGVLHALGVPITQGARLLKYGGPETQNAIREATEAEARTGVPFTAYDVRPGLATFERHNAKYNIFGRGGVAQRAEDVVGREGKVTGYFNRQAEAAGPEATGTVESVARKQNVVNFGAPLSNEQAGGIMRQSARDKFAPVAAEGRALYDARDKVIQAIDSSGKRTPTVQIGGQNYTIESVGRKPVINQNQLISDINAVKKNAAMGAELPFRVKGIDNIDEHPPVGGFDLIKLRDEIDTVMNGTGMHSAPDASRGYLKNLRQVIDSHIDDYSNQARNVKLIPASGQAQLVTMGDLMDKATAYHRENVVPLKEPRSIRPDASGTPVETVYGDVLPKTRGAVPGDYGARGVPQEQIPGLYGRGQPKPTNLAQMQRGMGPEGQAAFKNTVVNDALEKAASGGAFDANRFAQHLIDLDHQYPGLFSPGELTREFQRGMALQDVADVTAHRVGGPAGGQGPQAQEIYGAGQKQLAHRLKYEANVANPPTPAGAIDTAIKANEAGRMGLPPDVVANQRKDLEYLSKMTQRGQRLRSASQQQNAAAPVAGAVGAAAGGVLSVNPQSEAGVKEFMTKIMTSLSLAHLADKFIASPSGRKLLVHISQTPVTLSEAQRLVSNALLQSGIKTGIRSVAVTQGTKRKEAAK